MPVKARTELFKLENMIGSYLWLLKPQVKVNNGKTTTKYNGTFLWPKPAPLVGKWQNGTEFNVQEEAAHLVEEAWPGKAADLIKNEVVKTPFLDGDGKQGVNQKTGQRHEGYAGHRFIRVSADGDHAPKIIDSKFGADNKPVLITDPRRIYAGAKYHVVVNMYAWEHDEGGKGISFGLDMVQFAADGERIGKAGAGGANPTDFFSGVKDAGKITDAAKSGDGAGGLFS